MKNECGKSLVDSCLLVYFVDKSEPEKHAKALAFLEGTIGSVFYLSNQTLREFAFVCLRKAKISSAEIISYLEIFSERFLVLQDDYYDAKTAVELSCDNPRLFWDASIVSVMKRNGIDCILTENTKDFQALGVKAVNPLK